MLKMLSAYADAVKRYVHFRLAPRADRAEDVVQDVFLAACANLGAYRGSASFESWLLGIARNKVRDYYRARLREPQTLEALEAVEAGTKIESPFPQFDTHLDKESARKKTWALRTGKSEKAMERILARARDEFRWAWDQR